MPIVSFSPLSPIQKNNTQCCFWGRTIGNFNIIIIVWNKITYVIDCCIIVVNHNFSSIYKEIVKHFTSLFPHFGKKNFLCLANTRTHREGIPHSMKQRSLLLIFLTTPRKCLFYRFQVPIQSMKTFILIKYKTSLHVPTRDINFKTWHIFLCAWRSIMAEVGDNPRWTAYPNKRNMYSNQPLVQGYTRTVYNSN